MSESILDVSEVNVGLLFGDFDANIKMIEKELGVPFRHAAAPSKFTEPKMQYCPFSPLPSCVMTA